MSDTDLDLGRTIRGFTAGEKLFGRYTLRAILGRGGMGIVWRAFDEHLERDVALKFLPELIVLDHSALDELKRETKRNLELTHHNIVRIYDFVHEEQTACISMEYVDGPTLSAVRVDCPEKVLEIEQLEPLVRHACQALDYAHARAKIVHRDLKPANLMLNSQDQLKITDFGIARSLSDSVSMLSNRSSGGTLLYMSPQQLDGERPSSLDDIYSLGATLYELLTGKPPFFSGGIENQIREKIPASIAARRGEWNIESSTTVPAHWEETIAACLAKDPKRRPQSMREVSQRLRLSFRETEEDAPSETAPSAAGEQLTSRLLKAPEPARGLPSADVYSAHGPARSNRWLAISIGVVALLSLAVVIAANRGTLANWYAEVFYQKPTVQWVSEVSAGKMAAAFAKGESLRFDAREVTIRREAAGLADITIDGTATTRTPLYEALPSDHPSIELASKLAEMRTAKERAGFFREHAGITIPPVDEDIFQFVRELTPQEQTLPFHFRCKARREGTEWRMDKIVAADLEPSTGLPGKPLTDFRNAVVLGTDKANDAKTQIIQLIDTYVAEVKKAEAVAARRLVAQGLDSEGKPLFPPDRAMPGERFPQTRTATLRVSDLSNWSVDTVQYAINEVFARHGGHFTDKALSVLFGQFAWYHPKRSLSMDQIESSFSDLELQNVRTLRSTLLAKQEEAGRLQRAAAAQRAQEAAQRAQQEAAIRAQREYEARLRAQQAAAIEAQRKAEEQARQDQLAADLAATFLQGILNAIPRR